MNLTVITAVWQRPDIFDMFADGIDLLKKKFKGRLQIKVAVSGSEGNISKEMVESRDFNYVEYPNRLLGQKMNKASLHARNTETDEWKADYFLLMGSDDLMAPDIIEHYYNEMEKGTDYVYVTDFYFFDTVTKRALYWAGYRKNVNRGHACGAGRMISRKVMLGLDWQPWYNDKLHGLLDTAFDRRTRPIPMTRKALNLKQLGCFGLDIKSSTNMTPFAPWDNTQYLEARKMLTEHLPKKLADKIIGSGRCPTCNRKI